MSPWSGISPRAQPALAALTGTTLSLRSRTMSPTQMSRHFCQRKLWEDSGDNFLSLQSSGTGGWGCFSPCQSHIPAGFGSPDSCATSRGLSTEGGTGPVCHIHVPVPTGDGDFQHPEHRWEKLILPWSTAEQGHGSVGWM